MENKAQAQPFAPRKERGLDSFRRSVRRGMRRGSGKNALVFIVSVIPALVIILVIVLVFRPLLKKFGAGCRLRREKKAESRLLKKNKDYVDDTEYVTPDDKSGE